MIPRGRNNNFYPLILAIIKDQNKESKRLTFELYKSGLTTEQVGSIFANIYDHHYSKSAINEMMHAARSDISLWLDRKGLDATYPVIYIDATFWYTRRDKEVSSEAYYTILGVKEDTTREVLSIVNHPTEGASNWVDIFKSFKQRGVENIQWVVADGLKGIEDAVAEVYLQATIQLCTVHLKRNILAKVKPKDKDTVASALREVFNLDNEVDAPEDGMVRFSAFINKWKKTYPSLKTYYQPRYRLYFNYLGYEKQVRRMIYSTNWIERLNRNYKRVLKMRNSMPTPESVLFLLGSVAIQREEYNYPIYQFKTSTKLRFIG